MHRFSPLSLLSTCIMASLLMSGSVNAQNSPEQTAEAKHRPNLVFLLTDDQSTFSLGCYGNLDVRTPHIDRLARDGVAFDNHYDTTAICMASRANVFTGMYEFKHGCNFDHGNLLRQHWERSYPVLLRKAGYRTAMAGKIGVTVCDAPGKRGQLPEADFDQWGAGPGQTSYVTKRNPSMAMYADKYPHSTLSYGAFGRDFVQSSAKLGRPFCLSISFKAPHRPATPDPQFDDVYAGKTFSRPSNYGRQFGKHFSRQSRQGRQYARFVDWKYDQEYGEVMATYHQQVYAIDVAVGMIRDALETAGVADNTVIVFTSDNGFLCGSHGYGSKVLPYEESARVPLIIYDPRSKLPGGRRSRALTGNIDMAPTLLSLAGVAAPKNMDGKDLSGLYEKPDGQVREWLALINVWGPRQVHSLSVVSQDWKYVYWPFAGRAPDASQNGAVVDFQPTEELFHTAKDPLELELSNDANSLKRHKGYYRQLLKQWGDQAVPYHGYARFAKIFDPDVAWKDKENAR